MLLYYCFLSYLDCTRECTSGTLDTSCTRCECHGEFEGVVQSTAGVALNMVELYHSDIPYEVVYTTGPSGNYSLVKLCVSHEITFQKEGYIAQTYTADWLPNVVQLEQTRGYQFNFLNLLSVELQ